MFPFSIRISVLIIGTPRRLNDIQSGYLAPADNNTAFSPDISHPPKTVRRSVPIHSTDQQLYGVQSVYLAPPTDLQRSVWILRAPDNCTAFSLDTSHPPTTVRRSVRIHRTHQKNYCVQCGYIATNQQLYGVQSGYLAPPTTVRRSVRIHRTL
jgi:hypothetical protein